MNDQKKHKGLIAVLVIIILILLALVVLLATETISFKTIFKGEETTSVDKDTDNEIQKNESNNEVLEVQENTTKNPIVEEDAPVSTSNIKKQKSSVETSKILEYYKDRIALFATDSSNTEHSYSLKDINDDGIPELFIYIGGFMESTIIGETSIYSYDENVGTASNHYIVNVGTIPGRLSVNTSFYKMNNGTLLSVYAHSGYEEASTYKLENDWLTRISYSSRETENYVKGDEEIVFKQCSDTSLFDNYK